MTKMYICTLVLFSFSFTQAALQFASTVAENQRELVNKDLSILQTLNVEDPQADVARLFKITPSASNYEAWLAQRSQYVIPESFEVNSSNITLVQENYTYPNSILPDLPEVKSGTAPQPQGSGKVVTVMSNLGGALYIVGKQSNSLLGIDLPGIGVVPVTSPRVGIFKIGEGHFMPLLRKSDGVDFDTYANSLNRLATFFHEARHSDGNAKSLGFLHTKCPKDHNYADYFACDLSLNGPYTIGAVFLKSVVNSCENCSEVEKEALRNTYVDSYSRVLKVFPPHDVDPALSATLKDSCDLLKKLRDSGVGSSDLSFCDKLQNDTQNANSITTDLDDTPEFGTN